MGKFSAFMSPKLASDSSIVVKSTKGVKLYAKLYADQKKDKWWVIGPDGRRDFGDDENRAQLYFGEQVDKTKK